VQGLFIIVFKINVFFEQQNVLFIDK